MKTKGNLYGRYEMLPGHLVRLEGFDGLKIVFLFACRLINFSEALLKALREARPASRVMVNRRAWSS